MLIKILGGIDILAGLVLMFANKVDFGFQIFLFFGIILLIKSAIGMLKDFGSWVDFAAGISLILCSMFSLPLVILIVGGLLLIQKGAMSFI